MNILFRILTALVALLGLVAGARIGLRYFDMPLPGILRPHNILVVSVCSLRTDRLGAYNFDFKGSPLIDAWSKDALILTNAVAEEPWQNFTFEAGELINRQYLEEHDFAVLRRTAGVQFFVPPTQRGADEEWYWSEDAILHYKDSLNELKEALLQRRSQPSYIFTHLKYMHYPYFDSVNMSESDWAKLTPRSRELAERYRKDPLKYDAQLPVVEVLLNNFEILKKKFGVEKDIHSTSGVISDPILNERWRKAPSYDDDIQMVKEMYDLKMSKFDAMAAEVLNLFGDTELQKNTIVIFTGDHGEALADHGVLGHSVNVYDEMIRYPLVVKFPGGQGQVIDQQVNHAVMAKLVAGLISGEVTAKNFLRQLQNQNTEFLIARNCQDNIRTVRYRSEWKFIKNMASGKNELYNLKADPKELENLVDQNPDMAWKLEQYMIEHHADFKRLTKREELSRVCMNQ